MLTTPRPTPKLPLLNQWHPAIWEDYVALRDAPIAERMRLAFYTDRADREEAQPGNGWDQRNQRSKGWLWIEMGAEGINHAAVSDLFTMILGFWALYHPDQVLTSLGRCLLEKPPTHACAPDLVLYLGADFPRWCKGELRRIDLTQSRVPDLVGEIADTTLAQDLDEQKHLYAALGIPEYWVIDVQGQRIFAFQLQERGQYEPCETSAALKHLPIALLQATLEQLQSGSNTSAATWFANQLRSLVTPVRDSSQSIGGETE